VVVVLIDVLVEVDELVLEDELVELVDVLLLVEVLVVVELLLVVLLLVEVLVVVVGGGVGQPASVVGAVVLLAILKTLLGVPLVGALVTAPPAPLPAGPKLTQYVSPPLIVKRMPPSVPGAGGTTVMGPRAPLIVTLTWNFPVGASLMRAAFTGPLTPSESL
jgi:hypothetical protein